MSNTSSLFCDVIFGNGTIVFDFLVHLILDGPSPGGTGPLRARRSSCGGRPISGAAPRHIGPLEIQLWAPWELEERRWL